MTILSPVDENCQTLLLFALELEIWQGSSVAGLVIDIHLQNTYVRNKNARAYEEHSLTCFYGCVVGVRQPFNPCIIRALLFQNKPSPTQLIL